MNIYFFSYHAPEPKMIKDLGAPITTQFKGEISDIHSKGNVIFFMETLFMGGQKIKASHTIPTESIVIVEAPPILQGDWLAAGVSTLLVPQIKPETTAWGAVVLNYCRLIQIQKIEVITSPWSSNIDTEAVINQAASEIKLQTVNTLDSFSMAKFFQKLGWKPSKTVVSP
ncbi:hypothetical protein LC653_05145 [Nostoc sp. CHAB 5784]|uniref:hypothetical protein n=1 Tax=Nostoc mirabile TaxID=2907820 RepID=UPI001E3151C9|nr:hypothetical protein [Nostoc mirabile]MCC5663334.1 hypothetical protein [Nostoc mirabile CHAB5784]